MVGSKTLSQYLDTVHFWWLGAFRERWGAIHRAVIRGWIGESSWGMENLRRPPNEMKTLITGLVQLSFEMKSGGKRLVGFCQCHSSVAAVFLRVLSHRSRFTRERNKEGINDDDDDDYAPCGCRRGRHLLGNSSTFQPISTNFR
jgi:hypothetical protein